MSYGIVINMHQKPLCEFFEFIKMPVLQWAKKHGVQSIVPGIYRHMAWERDHQKGRPMGQSQSKEMICAAEGHLTLRDLRPDLADQIDQIKELEAKNGAIDRDIQQTIEECP